MQGTDQVFDNRTVTKLNTSSIGAMLYYVLLSHTLTFEKNGKRTAWVAGGRNELWPLQRIGLVATSILLLLCASLFAPMAPVASAHVQQFQNGQHTQHTLHIQAGGNGRVTGQLQDATNKNAPLAGQKVTLQVAQGNDSKDLATATTDAHGMYTFANLSTDKTLSYATYILYEGAQYNSDVITLDSKPVQTLNLTVYEATSSTAKLAVLQASLLVRQPDVQHGLLTISEIFFFRNLDSHTFVGSFNTTGGQQKPNALRFSLPGNARSVTLGTGFNGYQTAQVDLGFATNAAIPPGESQFSFTFQIPYTASTYDFAYTVVYPTVQLSFLIPTDIKADSGFLEPAGVVTAEQHPYQMFQGTQLRTDDQIHVQLQGLPLPNTTNKTTQLNATTIWLIAALLVMVAIVVVTLYLFFSRRRQQTAKSATRNTNKRGQHTRQHTGLHTGKKTGQASVTSAATKNGKSGKKGGQNSRSVSTVATEPVEPKNTKREALLQELLDLDTAFEAGKLSKATYEERRAKAKARLRSVMREGQEKQGKQEKQGAIRR